MKISCQSCGAKYNIADEKVRGKIVKIACKKCGARIEIDGREAAEQVQDQDETRVYDQAQAPAGAGAETWTVSVDDNDQRESTSGQIAELLQQGVINADTFVWRDGMGDWQAVRDVSALQSVVAGGSDDGSSSGCGPPSRRSPRPPHIGPSSRISPRTGPVPLGGGYRLASRSRPSQPARLGGSRRGGAVDLFATQTAARRGRGRHSAPVGGGGGACSVEVASAPVSSGKPIGARNENSVLFSLSALTASGPSNAPAATVGGDDEKSGLIDIQKLAASAKPGAKGDDRAKLDDIMNLGGGGAFGAALGSPSSLPLRPRRSRVPAGGRRREEGRQGHDHRRHRQLVALLVVALIVLLVLKGGGDAKKRQGQGRRGRQDRRPRRARSPTRRTRPWAAIQRPRAPARTARPIRAREVRSGSRAPLLR